MRLAGRIFIISASRPRPDLPFTAAGAGRSPSRWMRSFSLLRPKGSWASIPSGPSPSRASPRGGTGARCTKPVGNPGKSSGSRSGSPPTASFITWCDIWLERWWISHEGNDPWRTFDVSLKSPKAIFGLPPQRHRQAYFSITSLIRRRQRHQGCPHHPPKTPHKKGRLHGRSYLHRLRAGPLHLPNN